RHLDQAVGQRRFAMVDMGDDGEVADVGNGGGRHGRGIAPAPYPGNHYGPISRAYLHLKLIPQQRKNRYARTMSTASLSPAAARPRTRLSLRRLAAWVYARAVDPESGPWPVVGFAAVHAVLWTLILINLKAAQ